jgi:ankyrin repeat protein
MKAGADACAADPRGNTALMGALFKGEMRIAARLLDAPCNPDQRNAAGQTAAMMAALFGRAELLQQLKERGADLQAVDAAGNSAQSLQEGEVRLKR